jgi:hypothetical protein
METLAEAKSKIWTEITTADPDVTASFLERYGAQGDQFAELMAQTMIVWHELVNKVEEHEKVVFVANIVYCTIMLHVQSMKLFLSGHIVAAGNLSRQVLESIAMGLLCSGKTLTVLDRFIDDRYPTKNAVRDVQRHSKVLGLRKEALAALAKAESFYNVFSHLSKMTVGAATSFSQQSLYVGASFDEAKIKAYDSEVKNRLSLAKVFPNFVATVSRNVSKC